MRNITGSSAACMENVTETIRMLKERGFWVEIVTLVVPGFSDDADDLKRMAEFLASVDPLMPWHVTAFHPDYKMTDGYRQTTAEDLMRIVEYGVQAGLQYIYPGNLPGQVGEWENTRCHHCHATVIRRYGFLVKENRVNPDGSCPALSARGCRGFGGNRAGMGTGGCGRLCERLFGAAKPVECYADACEQDEKEKQAGQREEEQKEDCPAVAGFGGFDEKGEDAVIPHHGHAAPEQGGDPAGRLAEGARRGSRY